MLSRWITIINDAVCFDPPSRLRDECRLNGVNFTDEEWNTHLKKIIETLSVYQLKMSLTEITRCYEKVQIELV